MLSENWFSKSRAGCCVLNSSEVGMANAQGKLNTPGIPHIMKLLIASFLLLLSFTSYAATRIIGGEDVSVDDAQQNYPWMVSLRDSLTGEHICGGTLVDEKWVLSATHCFQGMGDRALSAIVGDRNIALYEPTERRVDIIRRVESGRDLMLMELADPLEASLYPPVKLADPAIMGSVPVGELLTVIGWGASEGGTNAEFPDVLQEAQESLISQNECAQTFDANYFDGVSPELISILGSSIDDYHLCAKYKELEDVGANSESVSVCRGDSGGPILYESKGEFIQLGVTSFVTNNMICDVEEPQVFTRVSELYDWIRSIIDDDDLRLTSGLNDLIVASVFDRLDARTGLPVFTFESVDTHQLMLTNEGTSSVLISEVVAKLQPPVDLDDPETDDVKEGQDPELYEERFHDYAEVLTGDNAQYCQGMTLASSESCLIEVNTRFVNDGAQTILLTLTLGEEESQETREFELNANVLAASDFSNSYASYAFLYLERSNEWERVSDLVARGLEEGVVFGDFARDEINGVEGLASSLANYDATILYVKTNGAGTLYFDWLLEDTTYLDLSLSLNGVNVSTLDYQGAFVRESVVVEDEGVSTWEFVLTQGDEWVDLPGFESQVRAKAAVIKALRFDPVNPPETVEEESGSSSGSGGGSVSWWGVLILMLLSLHRQLRQTGKLCARNGILRGEV